MHEQLCEFRIQHNDATVSKFKQLSSSLHTTFHRMEWKDWIFDHSTLLKSEWGNSFLLWDLNTHIQTTQCKD